MRFGVLDPDVIRSMTGREVLQAIIDGQLPQPTMCAALNYRLVAVSEGFAVFEGEPSAGMMNPLGTVHGGWMLTLLDSCTACAGHTLLPAGVNYTTIETKVNFSRAVPPGIPLRAEGKVVSSGRRIISSEGWLKTAEGKVMAHGTSTLLIL